MKTTVEYVLVAAVIKVEHGTPMSLDAGEVDTALNDVMTEEDDIWFGRRNLDGSSLRWVRNPSGELLGRYDNYDSAVFDAKKLATAAVSAESPLG